MINKFCSQLILREIFRSYYIKTQCLAKKKKILLFKKIKVEFVPIKTGFQLNWENPVSAKLFILLERNFIVSSTIGQNSW
jgi:hypothetical protein